MFNDVLNQVTGIFDRRFLLNAFFPCLIFWGLLGVVGVMSSRWEILQLLQAWNQQDILLKTIEIVGLIALVVFSASVLLSQSTNILRFYEGYWQFPSSQRLARIGTTYHQKRLAQLDVKGQMQELAKQMQLVNEQLGVLNFFNTRFKFWLLLDPVYLTHLLMFILLHEKMNNLLIQEKKLKRQQFASQETIYRYYPQPRYACEVMPTELGNILKSSEKYPLDRYKIDAVLVWSRLYHLLPDRYTLVIVEARSTLDFALAIATLSMLFSLVTGIWLVVVKAPGWLFLLCFWGGTLIAWLAYQSAIGNAAAYAEQIKVGFDLYRHEVVRQLRLQPAPNPPKEEQQWLEIRRLFYEGRAPSTWKYVDPDTKDDSQNG